MIKEGKELYIISGQYMSIGHLETPDNQKINVPSNVWKIIIVLDDNEKSGDDEGLDDLYRITEDTRVIAVVMPNTRTIRHKDWDEFLVSVDYIEELTGDNYLSKVPDEIEKEIEKESTVF